MQPIIKYPDNRKVDIVGDIHGCFNELCDLIKKLGYDQDIDKLTIVPPQGRKLVFVGDYTDRGPEPIKVLKLVMNAITDGAALAVRGNHDDKLLRLLKGNSVMVSPELSETVERVKECDLRFQSEVMAFLESLPFQLLLDEDNLVIVHGGMPEEYQNVDCKNMRFHALYGDPSKERDENGRPIRNDWAAQYHGTRSIVYGHAIITTPEWKNNTINIDTGCYKTGVLTALRWPEREVLQARLDPL